MENKIDFYVYGYQKLFEVGGKSVYLTTTHVCLAIVFAILVIFAIVMNRKIAKLYRTAYSTYRPYGIILRKIILCCRVDKGFDAHKAAHPAATGQINVVGWFEIQPDSVLADL